MTNPQQATGMTKETDRPMPDEQTKQERVNLAADGWRFIEAASIANEALATADAQPPEAS